MFEFGSVEPDHRPMKSMREVHKLVSYNVLSPHLCPPEYFSSCKPSYRLAKIKDKLLPHVQDRAIVCLQEVCTAWAGPLHAYFAGLGYHMITGLYGDKVSGYMGVALALPTDKYELLEADITRAADTKALLPPGTHVPGEPSSHTHPSTLPRKQPWAVRAVQAVRTTARRAWSSLGRALATLLVLLRLRAPAPADPWRLAAARMNQVVSVRLRSRQSGETLVAGTYHMPCMYRVPQMMMLHCALSAQHVQAFAGTDPYLFAGDFNIKPGSSMYRLLTEGEVEPGNPDHPPPPPAAAPSARVQPAAAPLSSQQGGQAQRGEPGSSNRGAESSASGSGGLPSSAPPPLGLPLRVAPMRSAYACAPSGREPPYTNNARTCRDADGAFVDTLDYVFVSPQWDVLSVGALPASKEVAAAAGPQPTEDEQSDHLLISATVALSP